jgi:hypothetical protein
LEIDSGFENVTFPGLNSLEEHEDEDNQVIHYHNTSQFVNEMGTRTRIEQRTKVNKVIIIGDSHARGCAVHLLYEYNETFEVTGNIMPGAGLQHITQTAMNEIKGLNCKVCVIIWGGSNDINKNETSTGLKHIMKFILQNQHTNIIIIPALHRHDLIKSSCINKEIKTFTRKLRKMIKAIQNVTTLDVTLDRKDFTRHGLHLNSLGKEKVALLIGQHITKLLTKQENNIFSLPWIDDSKGFNFLEGNDVMEDMLSLKGFANKVRVSGRSKKPPTTRTDDFLWFTKEKN